MVEIGFILCEGWSEPTHKRITYGGKTHNSSLVAIILTRKMQADFEN